MTVFDNSNYINARIPHLNLGYWEYYKLICKSNNINLAQLLEDLLIRHAKTTNKMGLLQTLLDEYSDLNLPVGINDKKVESFSSKLWKT